MTRWIALVAALLGVALVGYAVFSGKSDEELIAERLVQLEDAIRVDSDTSPNPMVRTGYLNGEFEEIFVDNVSYRIPELTSGDNGRAALATLAARSSSYVQTLDVDFGDINVELVAGGTGATVMTRAAVRATRSGGRHERDDRTVRFEFSKSDDGWQIASLRVFAKDESAEDADGG